MGSHETALLFEEKQRWNYHEQWWQVLGSVALIAAMIWSRDVVMSAIGAFLFGVPLFRPLTIRLTENSLRVNIPLNIDRTLTMDQIIRCEVVDYTMSFWRGAGAAGMDFPSECIRMRGNRGVRLDLTDGLHLLIGTQQPERLASLIRERKAALVGA